MRTITPLHAYGKSDIGNRRSNNEDVFALLPHFGFFALADGVGGNNAGEIAAHETISYICRAVEEFIEETKEALTISELKDVVSAIIDNCNAYVYHIASQNITLEGMGTTICSAFLVDDHLIYAHVGDSRIYLLRGKTLFPLTVDHSLVNRVAAKKNISVLEAMTKVSKSVITRSIGKQPTVNPDVEAIELEDDDLILLCSDGLTDVTPNEEIAAVLCGAGSLEEKTNELIDLAKSKGGGDNITIITVSHGHLSRQ